MPMERDYYKGHYTSLNGKQHKKERININANDILIIVGCPRSGTKYVSELLKLNNINVGHEEWGRNGVVSWMVASRDNRSLYGPSYSKVMSNVHKAVNGEIIGKWPSKGYNKRYSARNPLMKQPKIVHQYRDPLDCISSLTSLGDASWDFLNKYLNFELVLGPSPNIVEKAMLVWYEWNLRCEKLATLTYNIKEVREVYTTLDNVLEDTKIGTRKHVIYDFDDLKYKNHTLATKIKELYRKYEYSKIL